MEAQIRQVTTTVEPGTEFMSKNFVLFYASAIMPAKRISQQIQTDFNSADEIYISSRDGRSIALVHLSKKPRRTDLSFGEVDGQYPEIGKLGANYHSIRHYILQILTEDPDLYRGPNAQDWEQQRTTTAVSAWQYLASSFDSPSRQIIWIEDPHYALDTRSLSAYASSLDPRRIATFYLRVDGWTLLERIYLEGQDPGWNMAAAMIIVPDSALPNQNDLYNALNVLACQNIVQTTIVVATALPGDGRMPQSGWEARRIDSQANIITTFTPGDSLGYGIRQRNTQVSLENLEYLTDRYDASEVRHLLLQAQQDPEKKLHVESTVQDGRLQISLVPRSMTSGTRYPNNFQDQSYIPIVANSWMAFKCLIKLLGKETLAENGINSYKTILIRFQGRIGTFN